MRRGLVKEKTSGLGDEKCPFIIHNVLRLGTYKIRSSTGGSSPTHGTSNTYACFTLE
jgi:hypothetical protein